MTNLTVWNLTTLRGLNVTIFFPYTSLFQERQKRSEMLYYVCVCVCIAIMILLDTHFYMQEVVQECQNMNWGTFKPLLTDALIDHLHPIQVSPTKFYLL